MESLKIPENTILRLSKYSRYLTALTHKGISTISSYDIAKEIKVNPSNVRKDLSYFGEFGTKGIGYDVKSLKNQITKILSLSNNWNISLVGLGNLELALCSYKELKERGFVITNIFDVDPQKIGLRINGIEVLPVEQIENELKNNPSQIAIIYVITSDIQEIVDKMVRSGIKAILNLSPIMINVPKEVATRNVDLVGNLEVLTCSLTSINLRKDQLNYRLISGQRRL